MLQPPTPKDLEVFNFTNSTYLDSFLVCLLVSEEGQVSDQVSCLKSSFGQDLTYAGIIVITFCVNFTSFGGFIEN